MFSRLKNGGDVIVSAIKVFAKFPQLLAPLMFSWVLYAGTVVYFYFDYDWSSKSSAGALITAFGIILFFSVLLCFSACWLLEVIEQIETGEKPDLGIALAKALGLNLARMLPVAFVWATVWFAISLIDAITSRRNEDRDNGGKNIESATKVLAGVGREVSWSSLSFSLLNKLVRMLVFLSLPAICWRGMGPVAALREGLSTARAHSVEFLSGFALTHIAAVVFFLPAWVPLHLDAEKAIQIPDWAWPILLTYIAFAWSLSIYIEQMFTAELYLWHLKWKKAGAEAKRSRRPAPKLQEVEQPSLLDDFPDLIALDSSRLTRLDNEAYKQRSKDEALAKLSGSIEFSCKDCSHEFHFKDLSELALHDYNLISKDGYQVKCPRCAHLTTYNPLCKSS